MNNQDGSKGTGSDPWCEKGANNSTSGLISGFEDSFTDCAVGEEKSSTAGSKKAYVPLDDSEEHIAKLERKLEKFKNSNETPNPSSKEDKKKVLEFLKLLKEQNNYIITSKLLEAYIASKEDDEDEDTEVANKGIVDPKGVTGKVLRKCAPFTIALNKLELLRLLDKDYLNNLHMKSEELKETLQKNPEHSSDKAEDISENVFEIRLVTEDQPEKEPIIKAEEGGK